ncbi:MAG: YeeE/YedE thiosulfate transporter family protein [Fusobacterium sp.]
MKKIENIIGIILSFIVIFFGHKFLISGMLFFRLLAGITLGYALTRSFMGFAGSVNRAYNSGSTKLMRVLAVMFTITALISIAFLYNVDASTYDLWVNPINLGLILGGILFGFGMTFSVCCASGVLTDLVTGLPRAIITLLFFCMGVFLGFPIQSKASWVTDSWFTTEVGSKLSGGVYLPDLFKNDGLNGYIGASIVTIIFAGITIWISYKYEDSRKLKNTFSNIESESIQYRKEELEYKPFKLISERTYNKIFVKPWTMETGAIVITGVFTLLMGDGELLLPMDFGLEHSFLN